MFRNYFKIAFRNLLKHKSRTLINMGGLSIGVVCAVLIFLVIQFEYSFDRYHADADRIYRLVLKDTQFGEISFNTGVQYPLPDAMRNDFPQIEALTIVDANYAGEAVLSSSPDELAARRIREEYLAFVQPDYFELFTYEWLSGDRRSALARPNTVVISRSIARKLFGNINPMGRTVTVQTGSKYDLEVTGVVEDPPPNTDMPFTVLASYGSVSRSGDPRGTDSWGSTASSVQCYIKLPVGMEPSSIDARMDAFIENYRDEERTRWIDYFLQPLSEIHFDTRFSNFRGRVVPLEMLVALALIGLFLLVAACINFVNLNTAVAVTRSKEVGVRKAMGGTRRQLAVHFLGETALVTLLTFVVALGAAEVAVQYLRPLLGYNLELNLYSNGLLALVLAALFIATTLAAGLYPALYLSGFNPIEAIRNKIGTSYGEGLTLRRTLVVLQFAIAQLLIISTILIRSNMEYFRTADIVFDKEAVVDVDLPVMDAS
ncbi:MAG: ABC transporter permease, partial [Balneolaceae bacterium]|nr:ABC transporter permease [Balneolaceae bacterium]